MGENVSMKLTEPGGVMADISAVRVEDEGGGFRGEVWGGVRGCEGVLVRCDEEELL